MPDLHLSPADVELLKFWHIAPTALPEADREFLEEMRRKQQEYEAAPDHGIERVTPTEDLRNYAEAYAALEERCRYQDRIITDLEKRHKWLLIAVFVLTALAMAGWGR